MSRTLATLPRDCCPKWDKLTPVERKRQWHWVLLHQWSHSGTPFSTQRLIDEGECTPAEAAEALTAAQDRGWIVPANKTSTLWMRKPTKKATKKTTARR